jgi:hypothetical protein
VANLQLPPKILSAISTGKVHASIFFWNFLVYSPGGSMSEEQPNVLKFCTKFFLRVLHLKMQNTGHFIMYSGITKIYDTKTIRHVFMKPVQIEGTTQKLFPQKVVFHRSSRFCHWVSV